MMNSHATTALRNVGRIAMSCSFPRRHPCRDTIPVGRAWGGAPHDEFISPGRRETSCSRHPQKTSAQSFLMLTTVQPRCSASSRAFSAPEV